MTGEPARWIVRGYIKGYGPYASMSWCSGMDTEEAARKYLADAKQDTDTALIVLSEQRGEWERVVETWRPDRPHPDLLPPPTIISERESIGLDNPKT